jgi:ribonuclease P protein component
VKTIAPSRFTFKKEERLSRKKLIDELFENGSSFFCHPFRVLFLQQKISFTGTPESEKTFPAQVLISASTRQFKRAVDRNQIKRLTREAYRLNKQSLYAELEKQNRHLLIAILYSQKKIESFEVIQNAVVKILHRLSSNETAEKNSE